MMMFHFWMKKKNIGEKSLELVFGKKITEELNTNHVN